MAYTTFQELAIYQSVQDLSVWLVPHVGKWPKWIRPTLGHHTMEALMGLLRALVTAYGCQKIEKLQHLRMASAQLDGLRLLLATAVSLRLTSRDQYAHASALIGSVGKQLGGWIGQVR